MRSKRWWIGAACLSAEMLLSIPAWSHKGHRAVHVDFSDALMVKGDGQHVYCGSETFDYTDRFDPGCSGSLESVISHSHAQDDWDFRTNPDQPANALRSLHLHFSGATPCPSLPAAVFDPIPGTTCEFKVQVSFQGSSRIFYLPTTQLPFELVIRKYDGYWKPAYVLEFVGGATVSHGADADKNAVLSNVDTINCSATLWQLADKGAAKKIQPPVATDLKMCFSVGLVRDGPTTQ